MDPTRAWMYAGIPQKLCLIFVFGAAAVALVRMARLILRRERRSDSAIAASTRGLAQASLWLTGASAALGLISAWTIIGNSTRTGVAIEAEGSLAVFDLTAIALGACALIFTAAGGLEAHAAGSPSIGSLVRRAIGIVAMLTLAAALIEMRSTYVTELNGRAGQWAGPAFYRAIGMWLFRMSRLCVACGLATWACGLAESAAVRRRLGSWRLGVGS